ncbi:MAG TPA: MazG family protein [Intrasporangium sp.]|uniref:MazG family protein n=1 Tax=Intrasporangium sp. TaxID=1925024 RepID=UPI002D7651B6|nr:MazG family protein [Intrasporangium sp.]HET7400069.1 MazG family protein [Intrasporangium sp.]
MTAPRLTLLLTSPRVAPGLLTRDAWRALEEAAEIWAVRGEPQAAAVEQAGLRVTWRPQEEPGALARALLAAVPRQAAHPSRSAGTAAVWVGSSDGDPGLNEAVAAEVTRLEDPPDVEVLIGSHDVPGSRLLDVVAVMDRLRSPGGCPWDAQQTHESLLPYLLEEAHEAVEAIESEDPVHVQEELGDLLLQVAFHARVAEEDPVRPFGIDDVAAGLVDKLVRRHPHVFADVEAATAAAVEANWETIKADEKQHRRSPLDGVPASLPALARAAKLVSRLERAGRADLLDEVALDGQVPPLGRELLALVRRARSAGVDAEGALRHTLRRLVELSAPATTTEDAPGGARPSRPGHTGGAAGP